MKRGNRDSTGQRGRSLGGWLGGGQDKVGTILCGKLKGRYHFSRGGKNPQKGRGKG